ncbi:hypothetical protein AC249_AIPGENE7733 [Paramuricea clavata]|uniref:Uncharacterized protein n=1 Tax=Paramuricea clavata TaxID=317549 RepID=A0A6S7H8Q8_PARCT|nr:hypothetical protein AC249_AIPGENE7733 [Paramuricea clavata]
MAGAPAKQLNSKKVKNSLQANFLSLFDNNFSSVCCRAVWRVRDQALDLARLNISLKRLQLDELLHNIPGVRFFISAITAIEATTRRDRGTVFPAISFFIVYSRSNECNEEIILDVLHNGDVEADVAPILPRQPEDGEGMARVLFTAVKDHNNEFVKEMVRVSNGYGIQRQLNDPDRPPIPPPHFPETSTRIVVVDADFGPAIRAARQNLEADGFQCEVHGIVEIPPAEPQLDNATSDLTETIRTFERFIKQMGYALYKGYIYARPAASEITFVKAMPVKDYLNTMLGNDAVREKILRNLSKLQRILSEDTCQVVQQISDFDLDVIEVSNGCAFRISTREFFVFRKEDFRGKSSRAFVPYDCLPPPNPGRFAEGIINSFPDLEERVKVLHKLYRCLVAKRMPEKVRKLVFLGPKNSGKTSWSAIFRRIMPVEMIVSVASGGQFSAGMIRNETELVIANHLTAMTPRTIRAVLEVGCDPDQEVLFDCPFYITTNRLTNYGDQNQRIYRRCSVYQTKALPSPTPGAYQWIYDHAMDCVAWMADMINDNIDFIGQEERWYEDMAVEHALPREVCELQLVDVERTLNLQPHDDDDDDDDDNDDQDDDDRDGDQDGDGDDDDDDDDDDAAAGEFSGSSISTMPPRKRRCRGFPLQYETLNA